MYLPASIEIFIRLCDLRLIMLMDWGVSPFLCGAGAFPRQTFGYWILCRSSDPIALLASGGVCVCLERNAIWHIERAHVNVVWQKIHTHKAAEWDSHPLSAKKKTGGLGLSGVEFAFPVFCTQPNRFFSSRMTSLFYWVSARPCLRGA